MRKREYTEYFVREVRKMKRMVLIGFLLLSLVLVFCISKGTSEETSGPSYVGSKKCKACHKEIYKSWKETSHVGAFETLSDSNAVENKDCLPCHTTGYGKDGGFVDTSSTPKLVDVGCESCHGPGSDYKKTSIMKDIEKAKAAGLVIPTEETCTECHTKERSPNFDFKKYKVEGIHEIPEAEE